MSKKQTTYSCKICCNEMAQGAKKCVCCGSFQHPVRRALELSNTTLALLVALVSVIALGLPLVRSNIIPKKDDVRLRLANVDAQNGIVSVLVTNLGDRAAAISRVQVIYSPVASNYTTVSSFDLSLMSDTVIGAQSSVVMKFDAGGTILLPAAEPGENRVPVSILFDIVGYSVTPEEIELVYQARLEL